MTSKICEQIAVQISRAFKNETSDIYFERQYKKSPTGQLYLRYQNRLKHLRSCKLLPSGRSKPVEAIIDPSLTLSPNSEDNRKKLLILKEKCDFSKVEELWRMTFGDRQVDLKGTEMNTAVIFEKWPSYRLPSGFNLVIFL